MIDLYEWSNLSDLTWHWKLFITADCEGGILLLLSVHISCLRVYPQSGSSWSLKSFFMLWLILLHGVDVPLLIFWIWPLPVDHYFLGFNLQWTTCHWSLHFLNCALILSPLILCTIRVPGTTSELLSHMLETPLYVGKKLQRASISRMSFHLSVSRVTLHSLPRKSLALWLPRWKLCFVDCRGERCFCSEESEHFKDYILCCSLKLC